jgi:glycosyltransferase involved in cell wall biosynthesis
MAVYNGEKYLDEALTSVFNQTYPDVEIIICDDGSTDSTCILLNQYKNRHNITVLQENHVGMVHAFNKAFEASTGDAICFLAHDDVLPPQSIGERVSYMKEKAAGAIYCNGYKCTSKLEIISTLINHPKLVTWEQDKVRICRNDFLPGALLMIRREIAEKIFPIPENLLLEDWWVVFNTLYYADRIECLDKHLFLYRLHESNDTGMPTVRNFDTSLRKDWEKHIDYYNQLLIQLNRFDISDEEKQKLSEILLINKQVVANTLNGKYTFPSLKVIKTLGMPKYIYSQATISQNAYFFFALFDFLKRVTEK